MRPFYGLQMFRDIVPNEHAMCEPVTAPALLIRDGAGASGPTVSGSAARVRWRPRWAQHFGLRAPVSRPSVRHGCVSTASWLAAFAPATRRD